MSTSQWSDGYRAAITDLEQLANSRRITTPALAKLLVDLTGDALVIERERINQLRRRRLAVVREATLFDEPPP